MPHLLPMALGQPTQNILSATPSGGNIGTTVTASGSTNTKGSWSQLYSTTPFDVYAMHIVVANSSTANSQRNILLDIGVGGAGSEQVIISNYSYCAGGSLGQQPSPAPKIFPIFVPKGVRLAARMQSNTASHTASVAVWLQGGNATPPWKTYSYAEMIGADTATSRLVSLAGPGAAAGTETSWTSIGSTTSRLYLASFPILTSDTLTSYTTASIHLEWGWGSGSPTIGEEWWVMNNTELVGGGFPCLPVAVPIPASTQLQARMELSINSTEAYGIGIMGFY